MRDSILSEDDIGQIILEQVLKSGDIQSMVFAQNNIPPIVYPDAPMTGQIIPGTSVTRNLTSVDLKSR